LLDSANDLYLNEAQYENIVTELKTITGAKGKRLFMTLRVGITGKLEGPELKSLYTNITVKKIKERINFILQRI
jgi:glutamyl/glutaminyl-tRNA synthetase